MDDTFINFPDCKNILYNLDTLDGSYVKFVTKSRIPIWDDLPVRPHSYGYFVAGPRHFTERRHYSDRYQLFHTISGTGRFIVNGREFLSVPGTAVLLDCSTDNRYETSGGIWTHEWIHFEGDACGLFDKLINPNGFTVHTIRDEQQFEMLLKEIRDKFIIQDTPGIVHTSIRILRLLEFLYDMQVDPKNQQADSHEGIRQALRHIDTHYDEDLTLDELSRIAYLSKYYFVRLFHSHIGMSPHDYITTVRIDHAKLLLLSTSLSVNEIGMQVGFSSGNSFVRQFRLVTGMTPGAYRKNTMTVYEGVPDPVPAR